LKRKFSRKFIFAIRKNFLGKIYENNEKTCSYSGLWKRNFFHNLLINSSIFYQPCKNSCGQQGQEHDTKYRTAGQKSWRKSGWYRQDRKRGQGGHNMTEGQTAGTGQLRWDSGGWTAMTVKLGHDIGDMTSAVMLDRTAETGQSGQVGLTDQPGQVRQDRIGRTGCQDMTARTGLWGQVSWGQEQWSRTAGRGQAGQDRRKRQEGQGR
jgi:hypothetical protein